MAENPFRHTFGWRGTSSDPNDEQFGHVVTRTDLEGLAASDAVFVGEPYDGAVIGRRGSRKGPDAIREALAGTKSHHFDLGAVSRVGDLGDVSRLLNILPGDRTVSVAQTQERVATATRRVHEADVLPVFLGGDNSLTVPNVSPLLEADETVGVVSLDAHLDCREVRGDPTSGTPYRQLHEAGLDGFAVLGARHFETSTVYHDYVRERGGEIVTADEVGADPVAAADQALDAMDGVDRLYVSLDVDVLDAAAAPGVSAPTPGGFSTRECFQLLRLLASDDRLAGVEVVECAPPLDSTDGRTAAAAALAVAHVLAAADVGSGSPPIGASRPASEGSP